MALIRLMREEDIPELLDVWSAYYRYDPMQERLLREKIWEDVDYDPELQLVAEEAGKVVAFASGVVRPDFVPGIGWIKLLGLPSEPNLSIESALLDEIETRLAHHGIEKIQIFDSAPNYLMPGIDPRYTRLLVSLEHRGYRRFDDTVNMEVELPGHDFDTSETERKLAAEGIEIRRARPEDKEATLAELKEHFPEWVPEVERTFRNDPVSLHIALLNGKVVAFSAYDANNIGTGWFGPMGTATRLRGKGIGRVLYLRCLRDIQAQGHHRAIIPWAGPIGFYYLTSQAVVTRVFWRYVKRMEQE